MSKWSKRFEALKFNLYGIEYTADVTVWCSKSKEGEDGDGNRGEWVTSIDTIDVTKVTDPIGSKIKVINTSILEAIEEALYKEELDE